MFGRIKGLAVAAASLSLFGAMLTAVPAEAAAKPYHVQNWPESFGRVAIYTGTNCTGTRKLLEQGQTATSTGWRSFKSFDEWGSEVTVFNGSTGKLIVRRNYENADCVKAYPENDYQVYTYPA